MENTTLSRRSIGFGLALAVACLVNAIIVVVKEKSDAVMGGMKKITGHHWTTHSALVIVLFLGLGAIFDLRKGGSKLSTSGLIGTLVAGVGAATLIIIGFYLFVD